MLGRGVAVLSVLTLAAVSLPVRAAEPAAAALDHVAIHVRDADASAAFYKAVFGLKQVPAPVAFARWLVMSNGVMLHIVAGRTEPLDKAKWDHIALACADMDQMIRRLDAEKIPWADLEARKTPQVRPDGVKQIFVQDPDGYWIEINDALKPR